MALAVLKAPPIRNEVIFRSCIDKKKIGENTFPEPLWFLSQRTTDDSTI